jgi:hypothetical protein
MRTVWLSSVLALVGCLGVQVSSAEAQWGGDGCPSYGYRGFGHGAGGYGVYGPYGSYFGNGGHDYQPHGHVTQTPYGPQGWYGNGPHDFVPHQHSYSPWSYQGYSNTGAGPTTSFYNPQPYNPQRYYFAPW